MSQIGCRHNPHPDAMSFLSVLAAYFISCSLCYGTRASQWDHVQHNMGMHESLVDQQGFPRADVDIYQVRIARNKIISEFKDRMLARRTLYQQKEWIT